MKNNIQSFPFLFKQLTNTDEPKKGSTNLVKKK